VANTSIALFSQRPLDRSQNTIDFSDHSHNIELPIFSWWSIQSAWAE
jgi:hypothetical protein